MPKVNKPGQPVQTQVLKLQSAAAIMGLMSSTITIVMLVSGVF